MPKPAPASVVLVLPLLMPTLPAQLLRPFLSHTMGGATIAVAVADLNADGRPDLVGALDQLHQVSVRLAQGDLSFALPVTYPVGTGPSAVAVGDVDGDHKLDVVVGNYTSNTVSVLLGDGTGALGPARHLALASTSRSPVTVAIADMNGDGRQDIVSFNRSSSVSVFRGVGNGTFMVPPLDHVLPPLTVLEKGVLVDFNRDGRLDAVATAEDSFSMGRLVLWPGDGAGGFLAPVMRTAPIARCTAAGDLNGDRLPDLAIGALDSVRVYVATSLGQFDQGTAFGLGSFDTHSLAIADVDLDGRQDVVCVNRRGASVAFLPGAGNGRLGSVQAFSVGDFSWHLAVADLDLDGKPDVITTSDQNAGVSILQNRSPSGFAPEDNVPAGTTPYAVTIADVNGDGRPDLLTANQGSNDVSVLLNNGARAFTAAARVPTGAGPVAIAVGDLNRDGRPDLVTTSPTLHRVTWHLGDGTGGFGPPSQATASFQPHGVAIGDFNRDGNPDLVTANLGSDRLGVLMGNGSGGFLPHIMHPVGRQPRAVAVADLDQDGFLDLACANQQDGTVSVLFGRTNGNFTPAVSYGVGTDTRSVVVGDFNGDGRPDLATADGLSRTVSLLLQTAAGVLSPARLTRACDANAMPVSVVAADLDGDGRTDVATANNQGRTVSILLGNGAGRLAAFTGLRAGVTPRGLAAGDLDGDGAIDLVCTNTADANVSVLWNGGSVPFGTGTPGCAGRIGMSTRGAARLGSLGFGFAMTNLPGGAPGIFLLASNPDLLGSDPLGIGLTWHVSASSPLLLMFDLVSDASGTSFLPFPLVPEPALAGFRLAAMSAWLEDGRRGLDCATAGLGLVSSHGVVIKLMR